MNTQHINIQQKRKSISEDMKNTTFEALKTINAIAKKAQNNPDATFDNLMRLVSNEGILLQAMGNISNKSGALTKGPETDKRTADRSSMKLIQELSEKLKNGTFKFKPIRRVYMDKSGKNPATEEQIETLTEMHKKGKVTMKMIKEIKARPLGISSFPDKIVQESIRNILNAIYEVEFARQNVNFGFREKYGCQDAILNIKQHAKAMYYCIEGDVKGAFDNVNHNILIKILEKRIKDNKFLNLIKGGLKCGVMYLNFTDETDLGTVQGSVVSPLLYNIYFNEFDNYINTNFKDIIKQINVTEKRTDRPIHGRYNRISKRKSILNKQLEELQSATLETKINKSKKIYFNSLERKKEMIKEFKQELLELEKEQKKLPTFVLSKKTIRYYYQRYADDWVFFTNASLERTIKWKKLFTEWIQENLELELSPEKTYISDLRNEELVKFLGYQMRAQGKRKTLVTAMKYKKIKLDIARRSKVKKEFIESPKNTYKIRSANPSLIMTWDRDRVLNRMQQNGFISKSSNGYRGKSKSAWSTLREPEIIQRYNYIIRGYLDYYVPNLDYPTDIQYLHYLLTYSCAHTLAQKGRTKITKIFKKYGKNISINYLEKTSIRNRNGEVIKTETQKQIKLIGWTEILKIIREIKYNTLEKIKERKGDSIAIVKKAVDNICNVKVNWRTAYKLTKYCTICGSEKDVEYHHVRHIRKGKVQGFLQVMNQLNRKQIPVCKECHKKIHKGQYDSIALNQIYDEQLIIL